MSIITPSAFGRAKKSAGGVVFYNLNGQEIARMKAAQVANPNTPDQQNQRSRMAQLVALNPYLRQATAIGYPGRAKTRSAYNEFIARNIGSAFNIVAGKPVLNMHLVNVAKGSLQAPANAGTTMPQSGYLNVNLTSKIDNITAFSTDHVYVLVYSGMKKEIHLQQGLRAENQNFEFILQNPDEVWAATVFVFATTANGEKASTSWTSWVPEP
jgi:hypothetical protein